MPYTPNYFDISTLQEFNTIMRMSPGRVIVRFYYMGCPPCDSSVGTWLEYSRRPEYRHCTFVSAEVNENPGLVKKFNVKHVPMYFVLENRIVQGYVSGPNMGDVRRMIETGYA